MTPDQWFALASQAAVTGWILLAVGMFLSRPWAARVLFFGGRVVPLARCLAGRLMSGPAGLPLFLLFSSVGDQLAPNRKAVP